jgi:hypothetical protein
MVVASSGMIQIHPALPSILVSRGSGSIMLICDSSGYFLLYEIKINAGLNFGLDRCSILYQAKWPSNNPSLRLDGIVPIETIIKHYGRCCQVYLSFYSRYMRFNHHSQSWQGQIPRAKLIKCLEDNMGVLNVKLTQQEDKEIRDVVEAAETHGDRYPRSCRRCASWILRRWRENCGNPSITHNKNFSTQSSTQNIFACRHFSNT